MLPEGIADSITFVDGQSTKCPGCGSTTRLRGEVCPGCLLLEALDGDKEGSAETFSQVLDEVTLGRKQQRLGNYELLEEIGRGGMGVIYRARQRHSRRIVALKQVLSYHADSPETLQRFRREAEASASLDHPNILPIYEVGESEEGVPFFSMKFATGGSLREMGPRLLEQPRRSVALVAKIARATAFAHEQGILHRDLKPGNVLLDARGEPLVSDFGLAKWLDATSDLTRTLTIFGTPGYIAPEQAHSVEAPVTHTADIYSLGAILFDLLAGRPPFIGSHALSVIRQASETAAPKLRTLSQVCDRDLETICARCLEREPQARYQSASDLAHDLECWLEGKPIKARRVLPSTRVWRWSRRNRKLVATAAAFLLVGAASIWFLWQAGWLRQISNATKNLALSPQQSAEQAKLHQALLEFVDAEVETRYLHLGYTNASQRSMQERLYSNLATRVGFDAKMLHSRLPEFANAIKRDPEAAVYERANAAYLQKDYEESERLGLQAAVAAQKAAVFKATEQIDALYVAAWSAVRLSEFTRAMDHLREAEKLSDQQQDPRRWSDIQFSIGNLLLGLEQVSDAEKKLQDVIQFRRRVLGPEHRQTLRVRRRHAFALLNLERYAEAEEEYRELLRLDEKILGPDHPDTIWSRYDLATALSGEYAGDDEAALEEYRKVLTLREKVLGPEDPDTLRSRGNVAVELERLGQRSEAIKELRELVELEKKVLGPEDNGTLVMLSNLGSDLAETGNLGEAETTLREAFQLRQKTLGPSNHATLHTRESLIETVMLEGRYAEAAEDARAAIRLTETSVGVDREPSGHYLLGRILEKQGEYKEAEAEIRQAVRISEKINAAESLEVAEGRGHLARNLWRQGKDAEAEQLLRQIVSMNEKALGARAYNRANSHSSRLSEDVTPLIARLLLANVMRDQQRFTEAETEYKQVIEICENVLGSEDHNTLNAYYHYGYNLAQEGKLNEARPFAERTSKAAPGLLGPNDPATREYAAFLGELEAGEVPGESQPRFHDRLLHPDRAVANPMH